MTQEDKELLLKYLCMALPYDVKVLINSYQEGCADWIGELSYKDLECFSLDVVYKYVKPYLRPMSSMTEEEKTQMVHDCYVISLDFEYKTTDMVALWNTPRVINWLLEHHFDFMGLIPKGLAIAVTEENNPYKE